MKLSLLFSHRTHIFSAVLLLLLFSLIPLFFLHPDNSIEPLFPDGHDSQLIRMLSESPFSSLIFLELYSENSTELLNAAEEIQKNIPHSLKSLEFSPQQITPQMLLSFYPSFFDSAAEQALNRLLTDTDALSDILTKDREKLQSIGSSLLIPWIQSDPLRLRDSILSHFQTWKHLFAQNTGASFIRHPDGRHVLFLLQVSEGSPHTDAVSDIALWLENCKQKLSSPVRLTCSGGPLYTAANAQAVRHDLSWILCLSLLGFAVIYIFFVRSRGAFWILLTPAAATLLAASGTAAIWSEASGLALGFGTSLMGLAEDYAVHMHFALRSHSDTHVSFSMISRPLFQGCLLNCAGFFILLFSSIPAVRQLACFSLLSLTAGFLFALLVLPLLPWSAVPVTAKKTAAPLRYPSLSRILGILLTLLALIPLFFSCCTFDLKPGRLGYQTQKLNEDAAHIRSIWNDHTGTNILVSASGKEQVLDRCQAITNRLQSQGISAISLAGALPSSHDIADNLKRWQTWQMTNANVLAQKLSNTASVLGFSPYAFSPFLQFLHTPAKSLLDTLPTVPGLKSMLDLFLYSQNNLWYAAIMIPGTYGLHNLSLPKDCIVLDPQGIETAVENSFLREKTLLFPAAILCLALLWLCTRRLKHFLAVCIPPLTSAMCVLGFHAIFRINLTLMSLVSFPIIFGLALDHGIMVSHALQNKEKLGIRRAVIVSTLTAFMSMGLLAFARHPALRSMGIVIFIGLAAELFAALILIPLCYLPGKK